MSSPFDSTDTLAYFASTKEAFHFDGEKWIPIQDDELYEKVVERDGPKDSLSYHDAKMLTFRWTSYRNRMFESMSKIHPLTYFSQISKLPYWAFTNTFYDQKKKTPIPADLTLATHRGFGYPYQPAPSREGIKIWYRYFDSIFSTKAQRESFLHDLARFLHQKIHLTVIGPASSGKSLLHRVIHALLGSYAEKLHISSSETDGDRLNYEKLYCDLYNRWLVGVRYLTWDSDSEYASYLARTHRDKKMSHRGLYTGAPQYFQNQYVTFCCRTKEHKVKCSFDQRIHHLGRQFVPSPGPGQHRRDPLYWTKLEPYLPDLMSLLLDHYQD